MVVFLPPPPLPPHFDPPMLSEAFVSGGRLSSHTCIERKKQGPTDSVIVVSTLPWYINNVNIDCLGQVNESPRDVVKSPIATASPDSFTPEELCFSSRRERMFPHLFSLI